MERRGPEVDAENRLSRFRLLRTLFLSVRRSELLLSTASPFPMRAGRHAVTIVYDLRWLETRGRLSRWYRAADLRRTVKRSEALICISERTKDDLVLIEPTAQQKSRVAWLGPGLAEEIAFTNVQNGQLLLNGGAAHKRNELLARVLVAADPRWVGRVVGVGLSEEASQTLRDGFGERFESLGRVPDDEMRDLYRTSQYFAHFGVSEGFGMPYVEALVAGCEVIAIDQPLTREILGDAAWLVLDGDESALVEALREPVVISDEVRRLAGSRFDWDRFTDVVERELRRAEGRER